MRQLSVKFIALILGLGLTLGLFGFYIEIKGAYWNDAFYFINWYADASDNNRIIFKWSANQNAFSPDFIALAINTFRDKPVADEYQWAMPLIANASSTNSQDIVYFKPRQLWLVGFGQLAYNAAGLTYSNVSAYLNSSHCIKTSISEYGFIWFEGSSGSADPYSINTFCWGDAEQPPPPIGSSISIITPASGTTASSTFTMGLEFDKTTEDWQKIMVVFENWDASSTCPVYTTPEWYEEYDLGYFNYQSFPFFSEFLTATTGNATIEVSDLDENLYNCVRCLFINEKTGEISSEKCSDYTLTIAGFIPPSQPLPIKKWVDYYALHSDPKYATSTEIFNTIISAFDTIVQKVGSFLLDFRTIFDKKEAETKGTSLGEKIPLARGYLKPVNDFFSGNLPISEFFILCVLIMIIIGVFRVVKTIVHFIRG